MGLMVCSPGDMRARRQALQIQHRLQPRSFQNRIRHRPQHRFRPPGHPQSGRLDHRRIIGPIAYRQGLDGADPLFPAGRGWNRAPGLVAENRQSAESQ